MAGSTKVRINLAIKRTMDILVSGFGVVLSAPLWIIIAVAIKLDSNGPVLYRQERMTKDGKGFIMYKFRTMIVDADKSELEYYSFEGRDPRVTRIGGFLRSTSLDELPQLVNIIKGDLSLVGPRPAVMGSLGPYETMNRKYKKRFAMRGGITGLAQVRGRNSIGWEEKVVYDGEYIDLFSQKGVLVDMSILLETIKVVLRREDINESGGGDIRDVAEQARLAAAERVKKAQEPDG